MEPRECTIEFIYPGETSIYEVQLVNYQPPYRHSKWLFTMMINGHPYFSYQLENDEELFIMIGQQALHATTINITYKDDKRTKENLGFFLLGGALSLLFCELHILQQGTRIDNQAEIIDAYDQYWHAVEDQDMLNLADRFDYEDSLVINYEKVRENLVKTTNEYESNPNHIHK